MWLCDSNLINRTHPDYLWNGSLIQDTNISGPEGSPCTLQLTQLLLHILMVYLIILLFVYRKCCPNRSPVLVSPKRDKNGALPPLPPRTLFVHHVAVWNLNVLIALALSTQLAESLILWLYTGVENSYLGIASGAVGLLGLGFLGAFFHVTESRGEGLWLILIVVFHLLNCVVCGAKLWLHLGQGLTLEDLRVGVEVVGALSSLVLLPLLIHCIVYHTRTEKYKKKREVIDVRNVRYLHEYSSLGSRVTFFWFTTLLQLGYKSPLEEHHLGNLPSNETTKFQFKRFNKVYQQHSGNLWRSMWGTLWSSMLVGGLFRLGADFAGFVAPLGIKTIVGYTEGNWTLPLGTTGLTVYQFMGNGYVMGLVVLLSSLLQSTFSQCSTFLVNSEGIHIKVALQALIYEKALRLGVGRTKEEEEESSLDNILSEDTNNLMMFFWMAHFIWAIPLKLAILMGLLYLQLGYSALIGAGICILIMIPLQFLIGKNMSSNSKELMERCDERLRGISEILQGIKLLKLHGWELLFAKQVTAVRHKELKNLDRDLLYRSIMTFMTHISSVLVTVVTFGLYPLIESDRLEPPKVFAGLALFNQLTVPLFIFPITVPVVIDALVSGRRVREFLDLPEADSLPKGEDETDDSPGIPLNPLQSNIDTGSTDSVFLLENIAEEEEELRDEAPVVVSIFKGSFNWEGDEVLSDISLQIPKEKLTVVVGPTGSGKSSLVAAILGEMPRATGEVNWTRGTRIAYAAQTPWMLNASVRENILFGRPFKGARYKRVVEACALQPDIDILPENDQTEIGDKGINLSGGQKQRIAIARAFYSNANLVILDDPLSALDVDVAHHVLNIGIRKFLLKSGRTVLLVTHHHLALHHAHHIVAMEKGQIRIQGTLKEIEVGDPALHTQWHDMIKKKDAELQRQLETKTAKERWTLLKLVSKVGLQFRAKGKEIEPFRSRKGTFSHYKNLSHDIFTPSDSCHDEMITPLLRRRAISRASRDSRASAGSSSKQHTKIERMSSLQGEAKTRSPSVAKKFLRLQSLPVDEDLPSVRHTLAPNEVNRSQNESLIKRLFSTKNTLSSTGSSNTELDKETTGLRSTASGISEGDLTEDDYDDAEESLLSREGSGEEREYGTVPLRIYLIYIGACGRFLSGGYLLFALGYEVIRVYTNFWLSEWSDRVAHEGQDEATYDQIMSYYFKVYVILSLLTVAVSFVCNLLGKQAGANSRELLHSKMMDRLIRCPVGFFDSTPIGRIINRFSSDVAVVDRKLCISMQRFLQFVFLCLSAIVVNAIVNPWFLLVALPVVGIYYFIQRFYRFSSRELQRIQAISRGPIYSHFHETLQGLSTIRAFRQQHRFTEQMLFKIDMNNRADMFINVGNRWLSISLDYLGSVIVFLATLASMLSAELYPDVVTPSIVGLAINYTLLVPVYLNWVVKFLAEVEMFMNSVDRLDRYSQLEVEDYEGDPSVLPPDWPSTGQVDFQNVSVQYGADRPAIISQFKLLVPPKQKVGICGRSGSGKSSLLMSLFRVSDVSSGRILIDGVDIQKIPLLKLRSCLSIIPQENILFSGTLRFNLDPEGKVSDLDMWNALELAQMKRTVQETPGQLEAEMREGAGGFSVGQKQLLALARAILHKSKVVIMDEATSSVDLATELTLLKVVKDEFKESTVLTIAHRLETIADGDRVVVLEGGTLIEDGQPAKLMRMPRSQFATMIKTSQQQARLST